MIIKQGLNMRENISDAVIGVDIGKTKIASGIVKKDGQLLYKREVNTNMKEGGMAIVNQCISLIRKALDGSKYSPSNIGIGSSGVVDYKNGVVVSSGSIPKWHNIRLKEIIEKTFGLPTKIDNDVHVAALGEHYFGAGRGIRNSVYLTISTGIGVGVVYQGKIWHGSHGLSGQIAHLPLFGSKTVNDMFSGNGIARRASKLMGINLSTSDVFNEARKNNKVARKIIEEAIEGASKTIALFSNIIDPDIFIVGGSVALKQENFLTRIKDRTKKILSKYELQLPYGPVIKRAELGEDAGVIGAASLWLDGE